MSAGRGAETFHDKTKRGDEQVADTRAETFHDKRQRGDAEGAETRAETFHDKKQRGGRQRADGREHGQVNIKVPIFVTRNHE